MHATATTYDAVTERILAEQPFLRRLAFRLARRAADAFGYHHLTCSEHVAIPAGAAATRGTAFCRHMMVCFAGSVGWPGGTAPSRCR